MLDFDFWRCRELVKQIYAILTKAMDFSIVLQMNSEPILHELNFFKTYLLTSSVISKEVDR